VESQGSDTTYVGGSGRMARGVGGHALFSTQDAEDEIPGCVLGNCVGLGGYCVVGMEWWGTSGMTKRMEQGLSG
jgi:hypothetical protein